MGFWDKAAAVINPIQVGTSVGLGLLDDYTNRKGQYREYDMQQAMAQKEYERQKEFAQMGIQWKAADAKAAGLSPLAALGTNSGYSPVTPIAAGSVPSSMGQNISRALQSTMTPAQRDVHNRELKLLDAQYEETMSRAELNRSQLPPARPGLEYLGIAGQGEARIPVESAMRLKRTPNGHLVPVVDAETAMGMQSDPWGNTLRSVRNWFEGMWNPPYGQIPGYRWTGIDYEPAFENFDKDVKIGR